jgi:hypothetical protein
MEEVPNGLIPELRVRLCPNGVVLFSFRFSIVNERLIMLIIRNLLFVARVPWMT